MQHSKVNIIRLHRQLLYRVSLLVCVVIAVPSHGDSQEPRSLLPIEAHQSSANQHNGPQDNTEQANNVMDKLTVELSQDERSYLREISPIRISARPNWLPYESFDENGNIIGQLSDHVQLLEALLDIKLEIVSAKNWEDALSKAREGYVDILSVQDHSPLVKEFTITHSYLRSPVVIVMKDNQHFIDSLKDLRYKKIGLLDGYGYADPIQKQYPHIDFHILHSVEDGLIAVDSGRLDAVLCDSVQAIFQMQMLGLNSLRISGKTQFSLGLAFAVDPKKMRLVTILNKALSVIYLSYEQRKILSKWTSVDYTPSLDYTRFYQALIGGLIVLCIALVWAYRVSVENRKREEINKQLTIKTTAAHQANEAKSTFLAVMSHELRTPLHGMLGMLELLQNSELTPEQKSAIRITRESSESLLRMLNDILDLSKIEANKLEIKKTDSCLINSIEASLNGLVQNAYDKKLNVELYIEPELTRKIVIDASRVRQIINNLLSNAIKFTDSGTIRISAWVTKKSNKPALLIRVSDTGVGISKENQEKLFSEFFQVSMDSKRRSGGSGLGLSICRRLAKLMGGEIRINSEVGLGTTFTYVQPIVFSNATENNRKWQRISFAVLTENITVTKVIQNFVHFNGGKIDCYSKLKTAVDTFSEVLEKDTYDLFFVDECVFENTPEESLTSQKTKIIKLIRERKFGTNGHSSNIEFINTNPLHPLLLESLIDTSLGIGTNSEGITIEPQMETEPKFHLLVAEDHPTNQLLLREQLRRLGVTCVIASDGKEALKSWHRERFDGVITDCHMPNLDGYELARAIRSATDKNIPIIAMTANVLGGERARCIEAGMNDILVKPTNLQTLSLCLQHWFNQDGEEVPTTISSSAAIGGDTTGMQHHLARLEKVFFGRENVLPMLSSYWQSAEDDIASLKKAIDNRQLDDGKQIAHRMKGAAKIICADELTEQAEEIEQLCNAQCIENLAAHANKLEHTLLRHKTSLSKML